MEREEHVIKGKFGKDISLDFTVPSAAKNVPVIIFMHGFKGFKDWGAWDLVGRYFVEEGYAFCKFNYSHNGVDHAMPGDLIDIEAFAENNFLIELSDTSLVIDWVQSQSGISPDDIYIIGHSRAGGISLITAKEQDRVKKVVTWGAVSDYHKYIGGWNAEQWEKDGFLPFVNSRTKQVFNINYQFLEVLNANESFFVIKDVCTNLQKPVMVVHAKDDTAVSYRQAEELVEWSAHGQLLLLESGGHTFDTFHPYDSNELPLTMKTVCEKTVAFLKE